MSPIRYAFAHDWPTKIYLAACSGTCLVLAILACRPSLELFKDWQYVLLFVVVVLVAPVFGFFISLPYAFLVLRPLYWVQERRNGGPFKPGDRVQILAGPHKGKVTTVRAFWQNGQLCVELGCQAKAEFSDIVAPTQLLRESRNEVDERMVETDRELMGEQETHRRL
jgi:hypothetical protein